MQHIAKLERGKIFHIYNRGNNKENIFIELRNYHFFLKKYQIYIWPIAETFAYCLMRNHFHLLVRLRTESEEVEFREKNYIPLDILKPPTQQFSNLFNSYTKAINKAYERSGSLFQEHFGRIEINSNRYLRNLIHYIHFNPQKHGFVEDFRDYEHSSYHSLFSEKATRLMRNEVLQQFGSISNFKKVHRELPNETNIQYLISDDVFEDDPIKTK